VDAGRTLSDRLRDWHDRLVSDVRFQRWAAAFPLTRPIARRRQAQLFDLCAGFVYSQVLLACVRTDLFPLLAERPRTTADVARRTGLPPEGAERLLRAAAALRLVARRSGGRWGLGALGAPIVGNPGIAAMVEHHATLYGDLADPVALLRARTTATGLGGYWPYAGAERPHDLPPERVAAYTRLMSASQPMVAGEVLDVFRVDRFRRLLDVGGGDGTFLAAAAARAPRLELVLFDLPAVAERAEVRFRAAGLSHRAQAVGGSFFHDPLPRGCDLVSLVRVLHDHDDSDALAILRTVRAAMPADGTLIVAEPMASAPGAEAVGDAYFGFYLLAMGRGRPRTAAETADLLASAGFAGVRAVPTRSPLLTGLMVARPAPARD
jgi:demethylspheroidene O-methyltransferase